MIESNQACALRPHSVLQWVAALLGHQQHMLVS